MFEEGVIDKVYLISAGMYELLRFIADLASQKRRRKRDVQSVSQFTPNT